ncbi:MAG TPA: hypothetical protein VMV08_07910, partial [Gaiellaceae bacterium]|nr:hypothetical protein [Gaiellaceae bacterium]
RSFRRFLNLFKIGTRCVLVVEFVCDEVRKVADHRKQVVKVMCNSSSELTQALESLGLQESALECARSAFKRKSVGNVAVGPECADDLPFRIMNPGLLA